MPTNNPKKRALSVLSGGLDSSVATRLALKEYEVLLALTFDYGQRAAHQEIGATERFCKRFGIEHRVLKLPWLAEITKTALVVKDGSLPRISAESLGKNRATEEASAKAVWVPNRNGVFLAIAAAHAESLHAEVIIVGFNAEEASTFPDNSEAFMKAFNEGLQFSTQNGVKVISPTLHMNKVEIMRNAMELDIDPKLLWSCYEGGDTPCGVCESCARTKRAFEILRSAQDDTRSQDDR